MDELEKLKSEGWIEYQSIVDQPKWTHLYKIDGKTVKVKALPKPSERDSFLTLTLPFK